jgi:hypothetical protein
MDLLHENSYLVAKLLSKMIRWFFVLLACPLSANAQVSWNTVNIDYLFSFELPQGYSEKGEWSEKEYDAKGEFGQFRVVKFRHADVRTATTEDLKNFYRISVFHTFLRLMIYCTKIMPSKSMGWMAIVLSIKQPLKKLPMETCSLS